MYNSNTNSLIIISAYLVEKRVLCAIRFLDWCDSFFLKIWHLFIFFVQKKISCENMGGGGWWRWVCSCGLKLGLWWRWVCVVGGGIDDWKFFLFMVVADGWIFFFPFCFVAVGNVDNGGFWVCHCICGFRSMGKRKKKSEIWNREEGKYVLWVREKIHGETVLEVGGNQSLVGLCEMGFVMGRKSSKMKRENVTRGTHMTILCSVSCGVHRFGEKL